VTVQALGPEERHDVPEQQWVVHGDRQFDVSEVSGTVPGGQRARRTRGTVGRHGPEPGIVQSPRQSVVRVGVEGLGRRDLDDRPLPDVVVVVEAFFSLVAGEREGKGNENEGRRYGSMRSPRGAQTKRSPRRGARSTPFQSQRRNHSPEPDRSNLPPDDDLPVAHDGGGIHGCSPLFVRVEGQRTDRKKGRRRSP